VNRWLRASLQAAAGVGLLALTVHLVGAGPFRQALGVLTPPTAVAALALGAVATAAQALRWRAVAAVRAGGSDVGSDGGSDGGSDDAGTGRAMGAGRAVGECYRAGVLNAVLPGGLAGDALRAHRARRHGGWWRSATSVGLERLAGTALLLAVAAVVLWTAAEQLQQWALAVAVTAAVLVFLVTRSLASAPAVVHVAVWAWSALGLAALVTLFAVAAAALRAGPDAAGTAVLAVLALLGMSLPVGAGGFGPREALAAAASDAAGTTPGVAVPLAAGYGVLAVLSTAPGAVLLLADLTGSSRPRALSRVLGRVRSRVHGRVHGRVRG